MADRKHPRNPITSEAEAGRGREEEQAGRGREEKETAQEVKRWVHALANWWYKL